MNFFNLLGQVNPDWGNNVLNNLRPLIIPLFIVIIIIKLIVDAIHGKIKDCVLLLVVSSVIIVFFSKPELFLFVGNLVIEIIRTIGGDFIVKE